jgi:hypothetical protein
MHGTIVPDKERPQEGFALIAGVLLNYSGTLFPRPSSVVEAALNGICQRSGVSAKRSCRRYAGTLQPATLQSG